jgi:Flp pilus assembly protein TadG
MTRIQPGRRERRGAVAVLLAILLIPLLAMVAFAVDLAWVTVTKADLQHAADSAALAGAGQLMNGYVQYYLPGQTQQSSVLSTTQTSAKTYAKNFASYNAAGGVSSLALNDSDIEFGFTDANGSYTPMATSPTSFPNTVKATLRRDSTANGSLGLFFGPVIGSNSVSLNVKAAATIYVAQIDSFQSNLTQNLKILPMTYDINHWNSFLKTGQGPDGTTDTAANGAPQLQVYPSIKFTGNFGLLSLDQGNDGASTISGWIANGVSSSDLQNESSANLLPLSAHDSTKWDWKGNPGLKTSDIHTISGYVGSQYLLPLFKPYNDGNLDPTQYAAGTGQGSNYYYNIVQFVAITITSVDNKSVHVQPSAMVVPQALYNGILPASTPSYPLTLPLGVTLPLNGANGPPLMSTFAAPKLTQ